MSATVSDEATRGCLEDLLLARLPALLAEVKCRLDEEWPDYAAFLDADRDGVREAAAMFIRRLLELSATEGDTGPSLGAEARVLQGVETLHLVFEQVGRRQMQLGNDLTRLLTAFQLGARVAWHHVSATALEAGLPPDALAALADSVFAFVNQLSNSAAHGYLLEQVEDAVARERSREELAELLLSGRASTEAVQAAAVRAGWPVPATACVVLLAKDDEPARAALARLDAGCLPVPHDALHGVIVPDPDGPGRRARLTGQLRHAGAVVGPTVPLDRLPRSVDLARIAVEVCTEGGSADGTAGPAPAGSTTVDDPFFADENLDLLIVHRDRRLIGTVRRQVLAPLDDLTEGARDRLVDTLHSWLRCMGDRQRMAEDLHVHPQTVRYRMAQLQELFGDDLDSAATRRRLFLALAWEH